MKNRDCSLHKTIIFLLVIQLFVTVGIIIYLVFSNDKSIQSQTLFDQNLNHEKYTIYIGTNDKDTYTQLISTEQAQSMINEICTKYVDGYTSWIAQGGWVDENDKFTNETTLIYSFTDVNESDVILIMDEIIEKLNQNSILIEYEDVTYSYYQGKAN